MCFSAMMVLVLLIVTFELLHVYTPSRTLRSASSDTDPHAGNLAIQTQESWGFVLSLALGPPFGIHSRKT